MVTNRAFRSDAQGLRRGARPGFTLIDLMVSMAIIALLITLVLPSLSGVREATRRVVCASNQRQLGLGVAMYSDDYKQLPGTMYEDQSSWQKTCIVRDDSVPAAFDGLGRLFAGDYINAPQVFYCPSHHGEHPYSAYAPVWNEPVGLITVNYQYRGVQVASSRGASRAALVTDALATRDDFSHRVGTNVLRADYSVSWIPDVGGQIARRLPVSGDPAALAATKVNQAWNDLDHAADRP